MKKLLLLSVMAVVVLAMGCSKNDRDSYSTKDLVGTWEEESRIAPDCTSRTIVFRSDKTIEYYFCLRSPQKKGVYFVKGDKLIVKHTDDTIREWTIKKLTATELELSFVYDDREDIGRYRKK